MNQIKFVVGLFLMIATSSGVLAAGNFTDPKALLEYAYASYKTDNFPDDPLELYSEGLKALFAAEEARTPEDAVGPLDFDPFINAQDYDNVSVKIAEPVVDGGTASEDAVVTNFGEDQMLTFYLVNEGGGWKIDDIACTTPGQEWRLSEILATDPLGN
jgi:Protein of unknown function (DUF3828)